MVSVIRSDLLIGTVESTSKSELLGRENVMKRKREMVHLLLLASLIGSLMRTSEAAACTPFAEILPGSQNLSVGELATVDIHVSTCGVQATAVIFEIQGPHPTLQFLDPHGGEFQFTYEGIAGGTDDLTVTLYLGVEELRGEALVDWGPVLERIDSDTLNDIVTNGPGDCTSVLVEGQDLPEDPTCPLIVQVMDEVERQLYENNIDGRPYGFERSPYLWDHTANIRYGYYDARRNTHHWVGTVRVDAKISLNGRQSQWNMGADSTTGPRIRATLSWECRDSRGISCSTGGTEESVTSPDFRWGRFGHGDSVIHNLNIRYWYLYDFAWRADGYPSYWQTIVFDSHDFSCRSGYTAACRFYW